MHLRPIANASLKLCGSACWRDLSPTGDERGCEPCDLHDLCDLSPFCWRVKMKTTCLVSNAPAMQSRGRRHWPRGAVNQRCFGRDEVHACGRHDGPVSAAPGADPLIDWGREKPVSAHVPRRGRSEALVPKRSRWKRATRPCEPPAHGLHRITVHVHYAMAAQLLLTFSTALSRFHASAHALCNRRSLDEDPGHHASLSWRSRPEFQLASTHRLSKQSRPKLDGPATAPQSSIPSYPPAAPSPPVHFFQLTHA